MLCIMVASTEGLKALGELRRRNGMRPSVLKPELLDKLKVRLRARPMVGCGPPQVCTLSTPLGVATDPQAWLSSLPLWEPWLRRLTFV